MANAVATTVNSIDKIVINVHGIKPTFSIFVRFWRRRSATLLIKTTAAAITAMLVHKYWVENATFKIIGGIWWRLEQRSSRFTQTSISLHLSGDIAPIGLNRNLLPYLGNAGKVKLDKS